LPGVAAIILAAGRGSRIGTPKLKLVSGKEFFVNIIVRKLLSSGIKRIICVIHPDDYEWALENVSNAELVLNKETDKGMLFSVVLGIKKLYDEEGVILFPVDHPQVEEETIKLILETFVKYPDKIVKPSNKDKTGHPVAIPRNVADKIEFISPDKGLNETLRAISCDVKIVKVNDGGILKNINKAEDLI
jgi:molybdenum cofactor cytidylyltransferase